MNDFQQSLPLGEGGSSRRLGEDEPDEVFPALTNNLTKTKGGYRIRPYDEFLRYKDPFYLYPREHIPVFKIRSKALACRRALLEISVKSERDGVVKHRGIFKRCHSPVKILELGVKRKIGRVLAHKAKLYIGYRQSVGYRVKHRHTVTPV